MKSFICDEVSANVIIKSFKNVSTPLKHIFHVSLYQGVFPDKLKIAKLTPIFKAGEEKRSFKLKAGFHLVDFGRAGLMRPILRMCTLVLLTSATTCEVQLS